MKVQRQPAFDLELVPISDYYEKPERLSFSVGELFTPELLAQFEDLNPVEEVETNTEIESGKKNWNLQRRIYGFFKGAEAVTEENWNKYLFCREMKRIDIIDFLKELFSKNTVAEAM